uniref:Tissue factor pathway inhibitor n=1 Tax=Anser cygnoides TaxID=8845 RepID=A0A8B9ED07_ANSCY
MLNVFRVLLSDISSASPAQQARNLILKLSCAVKQNNLVTVVLLLFITGAPLPPLKLGHSICALKKDPGTCRGFFSRYFYNKETKLCEIFKYGGCLGNQNNFKSLEECQTTCQGMGNDTATDYHKRFKFTLFPHSFLKSILVLKKKYKACQRVIACQADYFNLRLKDESTDKKRK